MQAVIVHSAADYAAVSPSLSFSVPSADGASPAPQAASADGARKSFDEMIHEARSECRAPSEAQEAEAPSEGVVREPPEQPDRLAARRQEEHVPAERTGSGAQDADLQEARNVRNEPAPRNFQTAKRAAVKSPDGKKPAAEKERGLPARKSLGGDAQDAAAASIAAADGAAAVSMADALDVRAPLPDAQVLVADPDSLVPAADAQALSSGAGILLMDVGTEESRGSDHGFAAAPRSRRFALDPDGKIVVADLRTEQRPVQAASVPSREVRILEPEGAGGAELTVEFASAAGADAVQQNILSGNSQAAGASSSTFQAMLSNQIQQNAGELVRAGSIVLRDNDAGSIKLVLHPESLGSVKIDLHISGKDITGRIMVASQEAYNAFKESAETLRSAFMQSGFENAGFDLSFAGSGSQNAASHGFGQDGRAGSRFAMAQAYGSLAADSESDAPAPDEISGFSVKNAVNIVA